MIWFTSDNHFGHKEVLDDPGRGVSRPFRDIEEMDKALVERWNLLVELEDTVYILGDFAVERPGHYASLLNGRKRLVVGNHDDLANQYDSFTNAQFDWIGRYCELEYGFKESGGEFLEFVMFHYPILEWNGCYRGVILLHGHVHGKELPVNSSDDLNRIDVGVDTNDYYPYSIDDIFEILKERNISQ